MKIIVNGVGEEIADRKTVSDFLTEKKIRDSHVVVECNGVIIKNCDYDSTILCEDDRLEVLRILGGG